MKKTKNSMAKKSTQDKTSLTKKKVVVRCKSLASRSTWRSSTRSRAGTVAGVSGAGNGRGSRETSRRLLGCSLRSLAFRRHHESLSRQQATRDFRSSDNKKSQSARQAARGTKAAVAHAEIRATREAAERRNSGCAAGTPTSASDQRVACKSSRRSDSVSLSEAMAGKIL